MNRLSTKHVSRFRTAADTYFEPRAHLAICSLAIILAVTASLGLARADDELPTQEQALARALTNHPDIVAAKAKVALAEADLYGNRMEVTRQVLALYGSLKAQDAQIAQAKASLNQARAEAERAVQASEAKVIDDATRQKLRAAAQVAEGQLVQATGQREQTEKELRLLIGVAPGTKEANSPNAASALAAARPAPQPPQGPIVDTWNAKSQQPIKLEFSEMPLADVVKFLSDKTGVKFALQRPALDEAGVSADEPITVSTNEVPLDAALQSFEDSYPQLQFVLRDYGVLLTTKDYAQAYGYMPIVKGSDAGTGADGKGGGFF